HGGSAGERNSLERSITSFPVGDGTAVWRKHRIERFLRALLFGGDGNGPHVEIGQRSKVEPTVGNVRDVRSIRRHRDHAPARACRLLAVRKRYRKSRHGRRNRGTESPHGAGAE